MILESTGPNVVRGRIRGAAVAALLSLVLGGIAQAAPLSLEECVEIAKKRNPGLAGARYGVVAAQGSRLSSASAFLPGISASGGFRQTTTRPGTPIVEEVTADSLRVVGFDRVNDGYSSDFTVSQNLIDLPSIYEYRASGSDLLSARQSYRASEAALVYQVRQQYFTLLRSILLEQVATEALAVADAQLTKSEALFELGSVARADVLQARVNRAAKERDEIASRTAIEQERAKLATLLGLSVEEPIEIRLDVPDPAAAEFDEGSLIQEATTNLPEVQAAKAQARAARDRYRSALWSQLPTVGGSLFYGKGSDRLGDLLDPDQIRSDGTDWGFSVGVNWNIFDGMRTIGGIQRAKAQESSAQEGRREAELGAALGVRTALVAIRDAREAIRASQESVNLAEENLKLQQALYDNGGGTILEVNTAQADLSAAKTDLISSRVDLQLALALLDRALGR